MSAVRGDIARDPRLGKVADKVLAEEYGISRQRVSQVRSRLRIPAPRELRNYGQSRALIASILKSLIGRFIVRTELEVYYFVLNDFGSVNSAYVGMQLAKLCERGLVEKFTDDGHVYFRRRRHK